MSRALLSMEVIRTHIVGLLTPDVYGDGRYIMQVPCPMESLPRLDYNTKAKDQARSQVDSTIQLNCLRHILCTSLVLLSFSVPDIHTLTD